MEGSLVVWTERESHERIAGAYNAKPSLFCNQRRGSHDSILTRAEVESRQRDNIAMRVGEIIVLPAPIRNIL